MKRSLAPSASLTLATLLLPFIVTSLASGQSTASRGAYAEGNIGVSAVQVPGFFGTPDTTFYGGGLNINGGYKFSRVFAAELGATAYVFEEAHGEVIGLFHLALKATWGLGETRRTKLYLKLGPGIGAGKTASGEYSYGAVLFGGMGVGHSITDRLDINLQAQGETVLFASLGLVSLGVAYHWPARP